MYGDCITVRIATFEFVLKFNAIVIQFQFWYLRNSYLVLEIILLVLNSINLIFCDHKIDGNAMGLICI
jgi:hypothetical protein